MASAPAGWYPDPAGSRSARYWDGQRWTEHLKASSSPTGTSAAGVSGATTVDLDQLITSFAQQWQRRQAARSRTSAPSPQSSARGVTTHSTLVSRDTSLTHSPRVSGPAPRRWTNLASWALIAAVLVVGLVLLVALLAGGPDADLADTLGEMLG